MIAAVVIPTILRAAGVLRRDKTREARPLPCDPSCFPGKEAPMRSSIRHPSLVAALAIGWAACQGPGPGEEAAVVQQAATQTLTNPYGPDVPVTLFIGVIDDGKVWANYQRKSDGFCTWFPLSSSDFLRDSLVATMSSGNDRLTMPGSNFGTPMQYSVTCPNFWDTTWTVRPMGQGFNVMATVYAGAGDDEILCGGDGANTQTFAVRCYGQEGNDRFWTWNLHAFMSGGPGNDVLQAFNSGSWVALYGDGGDDCISSPGQTYAYQGGDGRDASTGYRCGDCEIQVDSCN
jgi:hypothetical protein